MNNWIAKDAQEEIFLFTELVPGEAETGIFVNLKCKMNMIICTV